MENLDKKQCECGMHSTGDSMMDCHGCHGGKHHLVKIILKLVILIIIFWCGFKLGEITGFIKSTEYGHEMGNRSNFRMMQEYNVPDINSTVIPTPSLAPTKQ